MWRGGRQTRHTRSKEKVKFDSIIPLYPLKKPLNHMNVFPSQEIKIL
jgi:hypothetical protein